MYNMNTSSGDDTSAKIIIPRGMKNMDNITNDLYTILLSPYFEILLLLKYSVTRDLSVLEKSDFSDLENEIVLIEQNLIIK